MTITSDLKLAVWQKARVVEGFNPDMFRKDACGAWISWDKYGIKDNLYGWEIDHICPVAMLEQLGYSEELIWHIDNLRAVQCDNNKSKSDDYPSYTAVVTSDGNKNIYRESNLLVNEKTRNKILQLFPKLNG
jgi:hypothetical protein